MDFGCRDCMLVAEKRDNSLIIKVEKSFSSCKLMPIYAFLRLLSRDISIWGHSFIFWTKSGVLSSLEQLLYPIPCPAWEKYQCNSKDKLVLPSVTGILSTSDELHYLWGTTCFGGGTRQYWDFPYQSWSLNMLFVCNFLMSILGRKFFAGISVLCFWCLLQFIYI